MATVVGSSTAIAPATSTLAELRRAVVDYVQGGDDNELLDVAKRELNFAIDRINAHNWHKVYSTQTITTVAGTRSYSLATDVKDPIALELLDSSSNPIGRLPFKSQKTLLEENPIADQNGTPVFYSIFYAERTLVLDTAPASAWVSTNPTMKLYHHIRLSRLTDASSVHGGPPEFDAFLVWYARGSIARIKGELQAGREARIEAEGLWRNLMTSDNEINTDWSEL